MIECSEEELAKLKKLFDECDVNDNGTIDWHEFGCMLDKLTGKKTLEEKSVTFNLIDSNHNGMISFEEFCTWWGKQ